MTPLETYVVVVAGIFGLVIGSFLNVVAYRVPAGVSLLRESRCPNCDAPVKPWHNVPVISWLALRGRCASCATPIAVRYPIVEAISGVVFALVTWWVLGGGAGVAAGWALATLVTAYLYLAAISIVLTLIDLDTRRLPNAIVLPSYIVGALLLTLASVLSGDWGALARAGVGAAGLYAFYFLLRLVRPDGMGGGDVKLAGVIGLYLGYVGWGALAVGAFAAFVWGGVFGIALILARRAGRKTAIPFGPWMIAGAWTGIFTGEAIARWYLGLFVTV
ncbi:A24 family peptidase [Microbacterium sp. 2FI]|uniref:prepilin peptidase n=1 Tax=Microbacterium sp. 2FI TaxID=2502193 RepID=UPI0010F9F013|nr:A24 family peptidase [Microbacterium sp. 2FI]